MKKSQKLNPMQTEVLETILAAPRMTPEEFLKHWDLTYKKLAAICGCSPQNVNRWFKSNPTSWTDQHTHCCGIFHWILMNAEELYPVIISLNTSQEDK